MGSTRTRAVPAAHWDIFTSSLAKVVKFLFRASPQSSFNIRIHKGMCKALHEQVYRVKDNYIFFLHLWQRLKKGEGQGCYYTCLLYIASLLLEGGCACNFRYIEKYCFRLFLCTQWIHLADMTSWQSLQAAWAGLIRLGRGAWFAWAGFIRLGTGACAGFACAGFIRLRRLADLHEQDFWSCSENQVMRQATYFFFESLSKEDDSMYCL